MIKIQQILLLGFLIISSSFTFFGKNEVSLTLSQKEKKGFFVSSYGIIPNNAVLIKNAVRPNEFLSNVFEKYKIQSDKTYEISQTPTDIFNTSKFKTGNTYAFILKKNGKALSPDKFIYEKNIIEYAIFDFSKEKISAELKSKPVVKKKITSAAVIKGSLYQTLVNIDANPILAIELSEIYKWTIDFYRIQEDDFFKVIYFENFVEGQSTGQFEIEAASFNHLGEEIKAFAYTRKNSDKIEYFDQEGNTLKAFFLQAPVAYSRISSPYTMNRFHPVTGTNKPHLGTDYAAPTGTPIYSTASGTIVEAKYSKYNGNYVKVKHNETYTTQYLHMSKIASGMKAGTKVEQGQVIGYVGSTGLATGPHVCYRFWKNGKQVDPYKEEITKADPLTKNELPAFLEYIEELNKKLDNTSLLES
jgi:murein DD-endopeptidase MepM/ murein hydrolase activator NlpD